MKRHFCFVFALLLIAACAHMPEPPAETAASKPSTTPSTPSGPVPAGTWSGDYGPNSTRRERIQVDLHWEGTELRGAVQSGFRTMELTKASFKPETGDISLEFDAQGNNNQTVHYVIEGKVDDDAMTGTWKHSAASGDFKVTRE